MPVALRRLADDARSESFDLMLHLVSMFLQQVSETGRHYFAVQMEDRPWDTVHRVSVEREGEISYVLKPKIQNTSHRLLCEVVLRDNVKVVTLRSTYKVQNNTQLPLELIVIDGNGKPVSSVYKMGTMFELCCAEYILNLNQLRVTAALFRLRRP